MRVLQWEERYKNKEVTGVSDKMGKEGIKKWFCLKWVRG